MTGPFVLEIFTPDQRWYTPQGGTTLIPLTGDWLKSDGITRYGCAFSVSDTDPFDFGGQLPNLILAKSMAQYGDRIQGYNRKDRNFKCTIYATGDTLQLAQYGVEGIQAALIEATQFSASSFMNDGYGDAKGVLLYLKYQPDSTADTHYFRIVSGYVDVSKAQDQSAMLANIMKVTLNLRISYAGFGPAVWLQNKIPNGTAAYALTGYTFSGPATPVYNGVLASSPGPGVVHWYVSTPQGTAGRYGNGTTGISTGMDTAWGMTGGTSDVWSGWAYSAGNQVGTDIVYTPEASIRGNDGQSVQYVWLAFEYTDNAAASAFCSAQLQIFSTFTSSWLNIGSAIVPTNNVANQRYAWNTYVDLFGTNNKAYCKFRVAFSFDRSRSFSTIGIVKKAALWAFPAILPAAMITLPNEYVSQAQNLTQCTVVTNIQGNAETPVKVKVANPLQPADPNTANTVVYQQLYLGARKHVKFPYRFYYSYIPSTGTATNLGVGVNFNSATSDTNNIPEHSLLFYKAGVEDLRARQYRVLHRYASNGAFGTGVSVKGAAGEFQIVPNGSLIELPSNSSTVSTVDAGTPTLPPYNGQHIDDTTNAGFGRTSYIPSRFPDWWVARSASSGTGAINITLYEQWFLPTDYYMVVDTRLQDPAGTNAATNAWSNLGDNSNSSSSPQAMATRELVIDTIHKTAPSVHMGNSYEADTASSVISAAYAGTGFMFLPATPTSPEPMQFCAVVRRQGSNGAPTTDVTSTDPIELSFLYMPAWEM